MNIELAVVPYENKTVLSHLIQLYRYDSSEFDGHVLTEHGNYLYKYLDHQWTEDHRRPFMVKVDGEIAGFVLVSLEIPQSYMMLSTAEKTNSIGEFFIMRKFRRRGVGFEVATSIFNQFPGTWEVRQTLANQHANTFWKHVISQYKGNDYIEELIQTDRWKGPVFVFQS